MENRIQRGILVGLISPIIAFGIIYSLFTFLVQQGVMDAASSGILDKRIRTVALLAICTNALWINRLNRPFTYRSLRGVIFITMAYAIAWFLLYYDSLYPGGN